MNFKKSIWNIGFFNGFVKMFAYATSFFWAVYYNALGFSGVEIGLITAIFSITGFVTILPSGFINDKIKSKNLITLALLLLATQCFGISQFHTFPAIVLFTAIGGIGYNLYTTSMDSLFYKSMEKHDVTKRIATFQALNYLFLGAGVILGGKILNASENMTEIFKTLITITGSGYAIFTIVSFILPKSITTNFEFIKYKSDILNPKVLFFMLIMFLFAFHFGAENTSYGLFVNKTLGLSKENAGLYMGFAILSMGIASIFFSNLLKKLNVKTVLYTGLLLSGVGHIFMTTTSNPYISFGFRAMHEIGDAAMFVFLAFGISQIFSKERVGGNASVFTFIQIIGGAVSSMIFGPLGARYGYDIPLVITGVTLLLSLLMIILFNKMVFQKD
ncbi:MAG TPA: MFS transporter [Candidatus Gracilibacteria bacterium]|nr:MFS transporter [Candidatus Gracilibacteria bacterium]